MAKTNWKTLCMGTVVAISGIVGYTSCENKNEEKTVKQTVVTPDGKTVTIAKVVHPEDKAVSAFGYNFKAENVENPREIEEPQTTHYEFAHYEKKQKELYDDGTVKVEFDYIDMPGLHNDNGKEQVSPKQQQPEKKEPPKGSISKDAFINALLEKNSGRGGKK